MLGSFRRRFAGEVKSRAKPQGDRRMKVCKLLLTRMEGEGGMRKERSAEEWPDGGEAVGRSTGKHS